MNDIPVISPEGTADVLSRAQSFAPGVPDGLRRAAVLFQSISSFEDSKLNLLRGADLSPNTYRSYLAAVKQLYQYTSGMHPLQVTPAVIEKWYESLAGEVDQSTRGLRIRGLKRFYKHLEAPIPGYRGPFSGMDPKLARKLNKVKRGAKQRGALMATVAKALLAWLAGQDTLKARCDHSVVPFLVTSGLRAAWACSLQ